MTNFWQPQNFSHGKLTIAARNSAAASELFLCTEKILELLQKEILPAKIEKILIKKNFEKRKKPRCDAAKIE